jgi:hypothetical protein
VDLPIINEKLPKIADQEYLRIHDKNPHTSMPGLLKNYVI